MRIASHNLESGRTCTLLHVQTLWLKHYFILNCDGETDPSLKEMDQMLVLALAEARRLASARMGDAGRYTLIFSGPGSRRRDGHHMHILLSSSRFEKAWLYVVLAGKNMLQALGLRHDKPYRVSAEAMPDTAQKRNHER